jgi:hypothetical protein
MNTYKFKIGWKYVYLERRMYKIVVTLLLKQVKLTRLKKLPNNLAYR